MRPYSDDLRYRFILALERGGSARGAARLLDVSPSTGVRWAAEWHETGKLEIGKIGGHKRYKLEGERAWILARLEEEKDLTIEALLTLLRLERGVTVCLDTLWRFVVVRLGKTFKKVDLRQRAGPAGCRPPPVEMALASGSSRRETAGFC